MPADEDITLPDLPELKGSPAEAEAAKAPTAAAQEEAKAAPAEASKPKEETKPQAAAPEMKA